MSLDFFKLTEPEFFLKRNGQTLASLMEGSLVPSPYVVRFASIVCACINELMQTTGGMGRKIGTDPFD